MTSNGTLLTNANIQSMIETNCKTISVSLDGLADSHNALRGRDCFEQTVEGIKRLVATKRFTNVQITTVIHKQNIHEMRDIYQLAKELGVDSWRMTNVDPIGRAREREDLFLSADDFREMFDFIRSCRQRRERMQVCFGCSHYAGVDYEMDIRDYFFICGTGILVASILYNGDIFACLDIERRAELIQGNIRKDDFKEVWQKGFAAFRQRRDLQNLTCASCSEGKYCRGDSTHTWDFERQAPKFCFRRINLWQASAFTF
jgi:radical SAM protein with 4Fe4S-binding SPASM domain